MSLYERDVERLTARACRLLRLPRPTGGPILASIVEAILAEQERCRQVVLCRLRGRLSPVEMASLEAELGLDLVGIGTR